MHGCMVYAECTETAAVSHRTSHVTTNQHSKSMTSVDVKNALLKTIFILNQMRYSKYAIKSDSHSFRIRCDKSAVSLLENGE